MNISAIIANHLRLSNGYSFIRRLTLSLVRTLSISQVFGLVDHLGAADRHGIGAIGPFCSQTFLLSNCLTSKRGNRM